MFLKPRYMLYFPFLNFESMDTTPRIALTGPQNEAEFCSSKIVQSKGTIDDFEGFFVENNGLTFFLLQYYIDTLGNKLNNLTAHYDNMILMGDFNTEPNEENMLNFLN